MKKLLIAFMSLFLIAGTMTAQDSPEKMLKNASKSLSKYNQNPLENNDKLTEALDLVKTAFESDETKADPNAWNTKGKIFNELASAESKSMLLNPAYEVKHIDAAMIAYDAFNKAMELQSKSSHVKDALNGINETESHLANAAAYTYNKKDYAGSFKNYKATLAAHDVLKANDKKSILDDEALLSEYKFYTAVTGYYGDMKADAKPYFMDLYKTQYDHPLVYEGLYNISSADGGDGLQYLEKGREMYPDDTGLLFAEINHYLKSGELTVLIDKLKVAIEREPNNTTVYTTLGNVYDQLYQSEDKAGNTEKSKEYFDLAYDYYNQALGIDSSNYDATYSIGALYYNKAASYTGAINELANDFSAAGTKKYDELKTEMTAQFEKAKPYFIKAETLNPKDGNPLIALKEIYARANDFEKVKEYKAKLEALGM